jgi:hypothetical protein
VLAQALELDRCRACVVHLLQLDYRRESSDMSAPMSDAIPRAERRTSDAGRLLKDEARLGRAPAAEVASEVVRRLGWCWARAVIRRRLRGMDRQRVDAERAIEAVAGASKPSRGERSGQELLGTRGRSPEARTHLLSSARTLAFGTSKRQCGQ